MESKNYSDKKQLDRGPADQISVQKQKAPATNLRRVTRKLILVLTMAMTSPLAVVLYFFKVRFVQTDHFLDWMGHLTSEPDLFQKSKLLGWTPNFRLVILAPPGRAVNSSMLEYWVKYFKVIGNPLIILLLRPLEFTPFLRYSTSLIYVEGNVRIKPTPAHYLIENKYESEFGGQPLLTLSEKHQDEGWQLLQGLGISRDSWFVCLHVREGGYHPDHAYHSYRDAEISAYQLAMDEIIRLGGWIIRMGEPSMRPLPPMNHVIDYAHSDIRADWMDLFCFSQCRFLLGTTSGASEIAKVFGVPAALTNYIPMGHGAYSVKDIWIPKLYWSNTDSRHLTIAEVMQSPKRWYGRTEMYTEAGLSWVDNSPEEILDLVVEMIEQLEGNIIRLSRDEEFQRAFMTLLEDDPLFATNARVGRNFLRDHCQLLPEQYRDDNPPNNSILPVISTAPTKLPKEIPHER